MGDMTRGQLSLEMLYATFVALTIILMILSASHDMLSNIVHSANRTRDVMHAWYDSVYLSEHYDFKAKYSDLYYGGKKVNKYPGTTPVFGNELVTNVSYNSATVPIINSKVLYDNGQGGEREPW